MLRAFRLISVAEGLSYLAILAVTLGVISRDLVYPIGMAHGVLFMLYLIAATALTHIRGWSVLVWLSLLAAAVILFAFIGVEWRLQRLGAAQR